MRNVLGAILFVFASNSHAGYLAANVTITKITNTWNNADQFAVVVSNAGGGTGPCSNSQIYFPRSASPNSFLHERAFAMALDAFNSGKRVDIYNYTGNDCSNAAYIGIIK